MPTASRNGIELHYETAGSDTTVAFVSDVGFGAWLWGWQAPSVAGPRRTLVWDLRGTGRSDAPPGPNDVDALAADFEAVLSDARAQTVHVIGAGLGGMVALRYAREYDRARTLTLFGAAASGSAVDRGALESLHPADRSPESLRESLEGAFSPTFRRERADLVDRIVAWRREEDAAPESVAAQTEAMWSFESGPLYELTVPTLVCHGVDDPVVPASAGERLAEELPRGTYEPVAGRHLAFVEHSRAVTDRVLDHIADHG